MHCLVWLKYLFFKSRHHVSASSSGYIQNAVCASRWSCSKKINKWINKKTGVWFTEVLSLFILFLRGMPLNSTLLCVPCFTSTPSTLRDIHWNRCTRTKSSVNAKPALQHSFDPSGTSTSPAHEMTHATSRNCAAGRARSEPLQVKLTQTGRWETANGREWRGAGMAVFFTKNTN